MLYCEYATASTVISIVLQLLSTITYNEKVWLKLL